MRAWSRSISGARAALLELSNIDAGYGGFQALFGVSMTVKAGEAVAVIGANGAGKTTLLRVISGLLPASAGTMTMEGVSLRDNAAAQDHRDRHRACARRAAAVSAPVGREQSQDRRLHPGGAGEIRRAARLRLRAVSAPEGAARAARRHALGRRAADVRDRARADERAEADPARRALDGARAGDRRAGVRPGAAHPRAKATRC